MNLVLGGGINWVKTGYNKNVIITLASCHERVIFHNDTPQRMKNIGPQKWHPSVAGGGGGNNTRSAASQRITMGNMKFNCAAGATSRDCQVCWAGGAL